MVVTVMVLLTIIYLTNCAPPEGPLLIYNGAIGVSCQRNEDTPRYGYVSGLCAIDLTPGFNGNGIGNITMAQLCQDNTLCNFNFIQLSSGYYCISPYYAPNYCLRLDGSSCTNSETGSGCGIVNWQYYSDVTQASGYEVVEIFYSYDTPTAYFIKSVQFSNVYRDVYLRINDCGFANLQVYPPGFRVSAYGDESFLDLGDHTSNENQMWHSCYGTGCSASNSCSGTGFSWGNPLCSTGGRSSSTSCCNHVGNQESCPGPYYA